MIQMLICRLTHCPGHDKATVVLEDVDRRLELACLIPMNEAYRLAQVLGLARYTCVPVLELIDGLLARRNAACPCGAGWGRVGYPHDLCRRERWRGSLSLSSGRCPGASQRTRVPIYATDEVLHHARPLDQPHGRELAMRTARTPNGRGQTTFILSG
jgi:hypothetical protein